MRKDFPESMERHDFDPKKWKIEDELKQPIGKKNAAHPVVKEAKPASEGSKSAKTQAKSALNDANHYAGKKSMQDEHKLLNVLHKNNAHDKESILKLLAKEAKKAGFDDPEQGAKAYYAHLKKTGGIK